MMTKLTDAISNIAYVLDCLMVYRDIVSKGCCNDCESARSYSCEYLPSPGQLVRYNCPYYKKKVGNDEND
jgi:hypothetical protein